MKIDITEVPTLAFDVGAHGSMQAESTKIIPIIVVVWVSSYYINEKLQDAA